MIIGKSSFIELSTFAGESRSYLRTLYFSFESPKRSPMYLVSLFTHVSSYYFSLSPSQGGSDSTVVLFPGNDRDSLFEQAEDGCTPNESLRESSRFTETQVRTPSTHHTHPNPHTQHMTTLSILLRNLVTGGSDPGARLAQFITKMPNGDDIARSFVKNYILQTG